MPGQQREGGGVHDPREGRQEARQLQPRALLRQLRWRVGRGGGVVVGASLSSCGRGRDRTQLLGGEEVPQLVGPLRSQVGVGHQRGSRHVTPPSARVVRCVLLVEPKRASV